MTGPGFGINGPVLVDPESGDAASQHARGVCRPLLFEKGPGSLNKKIQGHQTNKNEQTLGQSPDNFLHIFRICLTFSGHFRSFSGHFPGQFPDMFLTRPGYDYFVWLHCFYHVLVLISTSGDLRMKF